MDEMKITFGIVIVSDTCSVDPSQDRCGSAIKQFLTKLPSKVIFEKCIPDDEQIIREILENCCDQEADPVNVVLTSGGTGFTKRDVTPEATKKVIEKVVTGIPIAMMMESLKITPMGMLSRAVCGIRKKTLIINLPGSPKAVKECLEAIEKVIPHAVNLIVGKDTSKHPNVPANDFHSCGCSHLGSTSMKHSGVAGRPRQSTFPMISMSEVANIVDQLICQARPLSFEYVCLEEAFGRILSDDIRSKIDLPPFRASIKDGYAVIHHDDSKRKKVLAGITAGEKPGSVVLKAGYCARVNTGCPIPDDATAVVQVEDTVLVSKDEKTGEEIEIEILEEAKYNQDIRPVGCDIQKNTQVLETGKKLGSVEIGILSACGWYEVPVYKAPKIGILSTGNELLEPGQDLSQGCVYDSNRIMLKLLLKEKGLNSKDYGIVQDDEKSTIEALEKALRETDVLITTGSVSMGDRDLLKPILRDHFNAEIHFGRIDMKPGKPTTLATCTMDSKLKYILCLPGNPVSAMVGAHVIALPLIRGLCGSKEGPVYVDAKLNFSYTLDTRPDLVRTRLVWNDDNMPLAYNTGHQRSSKLTSFNNANALLFMPKRTETKTVMQIGDVVRAMLLTMDQHDLET